ncbi:peptide N-acetyl-beta-D-glucosaminyl asparaginase amidase A-domain-containing protein [Lactarius quietus]|nr:peptide N-acetyl-beta-D-glucosaminyl asparaginase amidase A-domain-containing protein [Lactarius quietus]
MASLLLLLFCANYSYCALQVDFQVAQPPPLPWEATQCTLLILQRTFGSSIGHPEVVQFTPPTDCGTPGSWAGIGLNFTVTSNGTQYSLWRTSTPEPTAGDGITWTYLKDVTRFIPLFSKPGTFILQLDKSLREAQKYHVATLEATFFASSSQFPDDASVPPGFSVNVTLPRNAVSAFAEFQASGNGLEEFWYLNAPNQFLEYFPSGTISGEGSFREVRVQVDGQVAGVVFPYPVLFAGAFPPNAWRPITPYGAIDLPTYHLDLTPFIPILTNGKPHNITLDVASAEPDHQINQNWYLSGLLQVKLDSSTVPTTGKITQYEAYGFAMSNVSLSKSGVDVNITLSASRSVYIEAEIIAGSGARTEVVFSQNLDFVNVQSYLQNFTTQNLWQVSVGQVLSRHNGEIILQDNFSYPLVINSTASLDGSDFSVEVDHSYNRILLPAPFILGTTIVEHQLAGASYFTDPTSNTGWLVNNNNTFDYVDTAGNAYSRRVNASGNVIASDSEGGNLAPSAHLLLSNVTKLDDESPADAKADTLGERGSSHRQEFQIIKEAIHLHA